MKRTGLFIAMMATAIAIAIPAAFAKRQEIISEYEAANIANSIIHGRVVDVDYEYRKRGHSYYEVEIIKNGMEYTVLVDARSGQIINTHDRKNNSIGNNEYYDPHGYYGYYGKHEHGEGYYDNGRKYYNGNRDNHHYDDDYD